MLCGLTLLTLRTPAGVIEDAEGLCVNVLNEKLRDYKPSASGERTRGEQAAHYNRDHDGGVRLHDRLDLDDALGQLWEELYRAWLDFDPAKGVAFRSYAVHQLRCRLIDWIRRQRGRDGRKAQANADAISDLPTNGSGPGDDARLEHALAEGALDYPAHSLADLRRVLTDRRDELAGFDPVRGDGAGRTADAR